MPFTPRNSDARIYIPDTHALGGRVKPEEALLRTTHLGIGAHQDDLEFMAFHGISACYRRPSRWFTGVTCTDGRGSPRAGKFAEKTDEEMRQIRIEEQEEAARIGEYSAMLQLGYAGADLKEPGRPAARALEEDVLQILRAARPNVLYTHNPADKHHTHIAVLLPVLRALRRLPSEDRPQKVYGCEVWRDLDWLPEPYKVRLDVSDHADLAERLNAVFQSQLTGKRYDLAVLGRRRANATFDNSHATDDAAAMTFALDLTPLVEEKHRSISSFTRSILRDFEEDLLKNLDGSGE
jgi:LmbE family N-acetylglucosaminyl deacetylase